MIAKIIFCIILLTSICCVSSEIILTDRERSTGLVDRHREALENLVKDLDLVLVIRPSDPTSTKLQKIKKYATKSLDVHDKSSNWGPMSGFVPTDYFFNKKTGQTLNGDGNRPGVKISAEHHHANALTWDTKLSEVNLFLIRELFEDNS